MRPTLTGEFVGRDAIGASTAGEITGIIREGFD
jgi:hypothetical protein